MAVFKWAETKKGLSTLLCRNAIITVLFNVAYQYSLYMKNAFRPLVVRISCGMPQSYIVVLGSLFSLVAFIFNVPVGALVDRKRNMLKRVFIAVNVMRALVYVFGYGMANTAAMAYVAYCLDGVTFCFCSVMGPALMAISVDRRAMGSAWAVYQGLTTICTATAKSFGISLFNNSGQLTAALWAGGIALLSAAILLFLDGGKVSDTLRREQAEARAKPPEAARQKKGKLSAMLSVLTLSAIPLALCIGLGTIEDSVSSGYLSLLALERNFTYLGTYSTLNGISGVITMFIGIICDLINPIILVYIALAGKIAGSLLISFTGLNQWFIVGLCMITLTDFFTTVMRVSAIKLSPYSEQGGLASAITMMMTLCMMVGTLPAGALAQAFGYGAAYIYNAATSALGVVCYTLAITLFARRKRKQLQG